MCSAQCGLHDVLRRSSYVEIAHQLGDFGGSCAITEIELLRRLSNVLHVPRAPIGIEMCTWFDVGGPCILASISAHFASRISRKLEAIHDDTHDNRRPHSPENQQNAVQQTHIRTSHRIHENTACRNGAGNGTGRWLTSRRGVVRHTTPRARRSA